MKDTSSSLSASWKVRGFCNYLILMMWLRKSLTVPVVDVAQVGLSLPGLGGFAVGGSHSKTSRFAESHSRKDKFSFTTHNFQCKYYT